MCAQTCRSPVSLFIAPADSGSPQSSSTSRKHYFLADGRAVLCVVSAALSNGSLTILEACHWHRSAGTGKATYYFVPGWEVITDVAAKVPVFDCLWYESETA